MLLNLMWLSLSASVAAMPVQTGRAGRSTALDSTPPLLTVDAVTRMADFWAAFQQEPDSIKLSAAMANCERLDFVIVGNQPVVHPRIVNMTAMAGKFPTVAAALKKAGFTPHQWEEYRLAALAAMLSDKVGEQGKEGATTPELGKNIAFVHAHQEQIRALDASKIFDQPGM